MQSTKTENKILRKIKSIFIREEIKPFSRKLTKEKGRGFYYKGKEFVHHSNLHETELALHRFSGLQIVVLLLLLEIIGFGFLFNWHLTIVILISVLTFIYFADLLFNLFLVYRSFTKPAEIKVEKSEIEFQMEREWPKYTVFCPLYKEYKVLSQFIDAMKALDYPKEKLQIMLLLEDDDTETIEKVSQYKLPSTFDVVIVPDSLPKTKPKALNYGLKFAKGEYSVIYDAEDIPDRLQLKKAILAFEKAGKRVVCIQAKLNFYNPHQNLLTRIFAAEYSLWFDMVLTGLQSINAPIPLGGTSNHFRTSDLRKLKGWDSFNVTEDCDLGMRLVKKGFKTAVVNSVTLEEASSGMVNWYWQRTRWIKGYIQTYLMQMRRPEEFFTHWREPHVLTFQMVVGGKIASMFINPVMWAITISYFLFRAHIGAFIESFFPLPILYMGISSLVIGNFLYMYYYMIGSARHGHHKLLRYVILVPIYWLMMSTAAWGAIFKFITEPHGWSKTKHGLHLDNDSWAKL